MNLTPQTDKLRELIAEAVAGVADADLAMDEISLEIPRNDDHGDWSTNVAMQLAGTIKTNPRQLASQIVEVISSLDAGDLLERVEVAGPGFINFFLSPQALQRGVFAIDGDWGRGNRGTDKQIVIEYAQPNTHKAVTIGHLRSAISGLALVKLYENVGYQVHPVNFYGDVGMHVAKATWGFQQKYELSDVEGLSIDERMEKIAECYVYASEQFDSDGEVAEAIRDINRQIYQQQTGDSLRVYEQLREWSLQHQSKLWESLGVEFEREYPESQTWEEAIEIVNANIGDLFVESDGAIIFPGEKQGLNNWVMLTSEGNPTYEAKDLALAAKKYRDFGFDLSIITTSTEQQDHFRAVIHCVERINPELVGKYTHLPFGWVLMDGRKTSSRSGHNIYAVDLLTEIRDHAQKLIAETKEYSDDQREGIVNAVADVGLKFFVLSHEFHKDIDYNPDQFMDLSGYSGPYVMYAYARGSNILRQLDNLDLSFQQVTNMNRAEKMLAKLILQYPVVTDLCLRSNSLHHLTNYLYDLAKAFNQFYTVSPVLEVEGELRDLRAVLVYKSVQVLESGLKLLGVNPVDTM